MKLGVSKVDITPEYEIFLAGYGNRITPTDKVNSKIHLRTFYLENISDRILIVSADIIWWGEERVKKIKKIIEQNFKIPQKNIILHATHNHSAPQTSEIFTESLGKFDSSYAEFLEKRLIEGISESLNNLEVVEARSGQDFYNLGINRRKNVNGQIKMAPNPEGIQDNKYSIISFWSKKDKLKGMLVHYTCHANITDENSISSDFPGVLMDGLEEDGVVSLYLQGFCANIRPNLQKNEEFYKGNHQTILEICEDFKKKIKITLKNSKAIDLTNIYCLEKSIELPIERKEISEIKNYLEKGKVYKEWTNILINNKHNMYKASRNLNLQLMSLGDIKLIAANGEITNEYAHFLYKNSPKKYIVLPLGYSNGMIGYVPTALQIQEGGYESDSSIYYFSMPGIYKKEIENKIYKGLIDLIKK